MNDLQQLEGVFEALANDGRINPTHISLYVALLQNWHRNGYQSTFTISKIQLMKVSKISSRATYSKCINALDRYGYIRYTPSRYPLKPCRVQIILTPKAKEQEI